MNDPGFLAYIIVSRDQSGNPRGFEKCVAGNNHAAQVFYTADDAQKELDGMDSGIKDRFMVWPVTIFLYNVS